MFEAENEIVLLESAAFNENNAAWKEYIDSVSKPVAGSLMAYHSNGAIRYTNKIYGTLRALKSWQPGGSVFGLTENFKARFGADKVDVQLPESILTLKEGESIVLAGIKFNIIDAGDDAYAVEISELNIIYRHMMGSACHNILANKNHIKAKIEAIKSYKDKNYDLILTSHWEPEGQNAVSEKISYLEKTLELAETSENKDDFVKKMKEAFPEYTGENYLDMSAGLIFA